MNRESQWRLQRARDIAAVFAEQGAVRAVILSGAVAEGRADQYSETHLRVIWSALPSPEQQEYTLAQIGGVSLYAVEPFEEGTPDEGYAPFLLTDLVSQCPGGPGWWQSDVPEERHRAYPVELENDSLQSVDRCLDAVLRQHTLNRAAFEMLGELQRGTILYGAALVDVWRQRLTPYPNGLKANVVEDAVAQLWQHLRYARVLAERQDYVEYVRSGAVIAHCMLRILFALNGQFGWQETPKRCAEHLAGFDVKPDACYERLCRALAPPLREGAETLNALAHESVALAVGHLPDLDTRLVRYMHDEPRVWSELV
jgi:hypothetical protein